MAELTVENKHLVACADCQVKHAADLLAHMDSADGENYKKAQALFYDIARRVNLADPEMYKKIRDLEHETEDVLTVLRDQRKKVMDNVGSSGQAGSNPDDSSDNPEKHSSERGNPESRRYLPHGLTPCEKSHPAILRKLSRCIKKVEKREGCSPPYTNCAVNPVAVCRASVKCP